MPQSTLDSWIQLKRKSPGSSEHLDTPTKKRKWWTESEDGNNEIKWRTLDYPGPVFPPKFEPLPPTVTMIYQGKPIKLKPKTEECVVSYIKNRDKAKNPKVYDKNFWKDWVKVMEPEERDSIRTLKSCNFRTITHYLESNKYFKTEKKKMKNMKNKRKTCMVDGFEETIENPMVEPPGVFIGKGDHPLNGRIKPRIVPEMVTVNCSDGTECRPPAGHTFKETQHDNKDLYLASWFDEVLEKKKYIQLRATSSQKGRRDKRKFDIARKMHREIPRLRELCTSDLGSENHVLVQNHLALYLMIRCALRPGYSKKPWLSAATKGLCSLTLSNIKLSKKGKSYSLALDFLGKSSVPFTKVIDLPKSVYKKLREFWTEKEMEDRIFDSVKAPTLNKFFQTICRCPESQRPTLKTLRTYLAGELFQSKLEAIKRDNKNIMVEEYESALQEVSNMLNHTGKNTAKVNYIDPRITVAWCLKWNIPITDVFTEFQTEKFVWAIEMTDRNFKFM